MNKTGLMKNQNYNWNFYDIVNIKKLHEKFTEF